LHVPLLVSLPGNSIAETIEYPVSTLDIVPTILGYAGLSSEGLPGSPLVTQDGLPEPEENPVVYASATGEDQYEGIRRFAAREPRWKAVVERKIDSGEIQTERVFDLHDDPHEQNILSPSEVDTGGVIEDLRALSISRLSDVDDESDQITEEQNNEINDRLEALGYK
jgi:arylsulfatase